MKNKQQGLTRRDFIRGTVGATLAVSVLGVPLAEGSEKAVGTSLVTVVRDKNVMDAGFKIDTKILETMLDQYEHGQVQNLLEWHLQMFQPA